MRLLGSGGYAFAKLTEKEELKANLGVPQIFLSNVGRLSEDSTQKNILVIQRLATKIQMKN